MTHTTRQVRSSAHVSPVRETRDTTVRRPRVRQRKVSHRGSKLLVMSVLILLTVVLGVNGSRLLERSRLQIEREAELTAQIQEQLRRAEEIETFAEYVNSDLFLRRIAEERLGLVDPNEIIFRPVD